MVPCPMAVPARRRVTYAEYLALEALSPTKNEYFQGEILAMAGGTTPHADLAINMVGLFLTGLQGKPCRPSNSDQRLRVPATGLATYPDVAVYCAPRTPHPEDPDALTNPTLLVEVLWKGTEAYDRGQKFEHYRQLSTLRHYVLVSSERVAVEVFTPNDDGSWNLRAFSAGDTFRLDALGLVLAVDEVYAGVDLSPPT